MVSRADSFTNRPDFSHGTRYYLSRMVLIHEAGVASTQARKQGHNSQQVWLTALPPNKGR
jgi:hypothetical protein